jgi:hypothetical protein
MCNYQSLDLRGTQFFLPFTPHHSAPDLIGATTRLEIPNLGIGRRSWNPLQWILSLPTVFQPRASSFKSFRLFHLYFICISSAFHLHFICISSALWMASISSMDEERAERHVIHDSFRAMRRTLFQKRPQYTPKGWFLCQKCAKTVVSQNM